MASLPFLVIPLDLGTIATGNEIAAKPASHLGMFDAIGMTWRSSGASNLWIRGDMTTARAIDFVSLVHANALGGTTIRVRLGDSQAAVDGTASYDSGASPFISPAITRSDGLYSSHLELPSLQTRRWWRIDIGSHTGDFEAAKLILGKKVSPASYYSSGFEYGAQQLGALAMTPWGIPDISPGLLFRTLRFTLACLTETEFETKFRPLFETGALGRLAPAFWCFDPTANVYRQQRSYLGWLKEDPLATVGASVVGRHSMGFNILSMI